MNIHSEKLSMLRKAMMQNGIDVYLIPSTDPHLGEYIPDHWRIIEWLTGFTGSAGSVVITDTFAGLWTDSRYFIQAERQLSDSGFVLISPSPCEKKDFIDWLTGCTDPGSKVALDGRLFSIDQTRRIENSSGGKNLSIDFNCDLISDLWTERPPMPVSLAFDHSEVFCGKDRSGKISEVREQMRIKGIDYHLLTSADDIMWLLNIRGNDIKYTPLLISFALVDEMQILFFIDEDKIPLKLAAEFDRLKIVILPYEELAGILSTLPHDSSILLNPQTTSRSLFNSVPQRMKIIEELSIPTRLKAVKNKIEINSIGNAMIKDGVALTKFFFWLESNLDSEPLSELSLGEKLSSFRTGGENYLGPSFSIIVAFNEHGASPHYTATPDTDILVNGNGILLIDSGGQYFDGTTDITRTICIGRPTVRQKQDFSLVLKGTINLALAKFPYGTKGYQLDILARRALWENGLNYGHGTGHGVGFCLNVHEGPQNIGPEAATGSKTVIEPGMLISDEPAIYRAGEYGIRTENMILCFEDEETEFGKFLRFDTVSLCYIDKSLIDISLLDKKEIDWLNSYHSEVFGKLSPYLSIEEKNWLKNKTCSI
jgi:Xaa-Pro aminopeptidase